MGRKKSKKPHKGSQEPNAQSTSSTQFQLGELVILFTAVALFLPGLFAEMDNIYLALPVIIFFATASCIKWLPMNVPFNIPFSMAYKQSDIKSYLAVSMFLCLPLALMLINKWPQEFPFEGDYDHHTYAGIAASQFWGKAFWVGAGAIVSYYIAGKFSKKWRTLAPLGVILISGYFFEAPNYYLARYPGAAYFFASPWVALGQTMEWNNILNAMRISTFLSIPIYLFILRPLFFEKLLTPGFLIFAGFLLLQRDMILFSTSPYLEPWSLLICFFAIELAATEKKRLPVALLFLAIASVFKEQSVFVIPFIWILFFLNREKSISHFRTIDLGLASIIPFAIYFFYRKQANIWRQTEFSSFAEAFSAERLSQGLDALSQQFQVTGLLLLPAFGMILFLIFSQQKTKFTKHFVVLLVLASVFQFLFFFMDKLTLDYPMYSRFYFFCFALLASTAFLLPAKENWIKNKLIIAAIGLTFLGNSLSLFESLSLSFSDAYQRNSRDLPRSPEHYPIRSLILQAEKKALLPAGSSVFINYPKQRFIGQSLQLGYRDLVSKYKFGSNEKTFLNPICDCNRLKQNILLPFSYHNPEIKIDPLPKQRVLRQQQCIDQLKTQCRQVFEEKAQDGTVVGYLGIL